MSYIDIQNVHKKYGDKAILKGIDLQVDQHDVVCLIGASGSGKSTLLRCINALEPIQNGHISIGGDVVSGPGVNVDKLRSEVGMVFQSYNLFPHMTVLENIMLAPVMLGRFTKSEAKERGLSLLERVNLAQHADHYPDQLSGGQQQRVAMVRALTVGPSTLLLDEITSALDPELVAEVLNIVRDLANDGMTMLLATHEMGFAREVATKVVFLDSGRILEQGTPEQIFSDPQEPRTQLFLKKIVEAGRI